MADASQMAPSGAPGPSQNSLTLAKEARKRAELDAQLLANRIALLKQEEEKAWKKIEETQKKSSEIVNLRKNNEQKFSAKEQFYKAKWESIKTAQAQNSRARENQRALREATKEGILSQRQQNAKATKEHSQQMLLQKKDREAAEKQANAERSSYLKAKKLDAKRKLEDQRREQLEKFREDYEARAAQEEMLRTRTEMLVAKMEKEEMDLIQRLQNTQTIQRNAYEELESALGQTSSPMAPSGTGLQKQGPAPVG